MSVVTKIFLLNFMAVIAACFIDRIMLDDALQKAKVVGWLFGLWCSLSILSAPVWLVWLIVTA